MGKSIRDQLRTDTVMFEYDVHDMRRAVNWYKEILGFEIVFQGGDCHTEFALPVPGARLALSLTDAGKPIQKAARLFLRTDDIDAVKIYLQEKGVNLRPIENVDDVVRILWVEDCEGNHFAFEEWDRRDDPGRSS